MKCPECYTHPEAADLQVKQEPSSFCHKLPAFSILTASLHPLFNQGFQLVLPPCHVGSRFSWGHCQLFSSLTVQALLTSPFINLHCSSMTCRSTDPPGKAKAGRCGRQSPSPNGEPAAALTRPSLRHTANGGRAMAPSRLPGSPPWHRAAPRQMAAVLRAEFAVTLITWQKPRKGVAVGVSSSFIEKVFNLLKRYLTEVAFSKVKT